jgi:hypothetical protein
MVRMPVRLVENTGPAKDLEPESMTVDGGVGAPFPVAGAESGLLTMSLKIPSLLLGRIAPSLEGDAVEDCPAAGSRLRSITPFSSSLMSSGAMAALAPSVAVTASAGWALMCEYQTNPPISEAEKRITATRAVVDLPVDAGVMAESTGAVMEGIRRDAVLGPVVPNRSPEDKLFRGESLYTPFTQHNKNGGSENPPHMVRSADPTS